MKHSIAENSVQIAPADMIIIDTSFGTVNTKIDPGTIDIAPDDKKNYQQFGPKVESVALAAKDIIDNHAGIFPADYDTTRIATFIKKHDDYDHIHLAATEIAVKAESTASVCGILAVNEMNVVYGYVLMALPTHPELKTQADIFAAFYAKSKNIPNVVFSFTAGSSMDFNNAIPKSSVNNMGTTRIGLVAGPELSNSVPRVDKIIIEPGDSALIPPKYKSITIRNESSDMAGSFSLKYKA